MEINFLYVILAIVAVAIIFLFACIRILREYERGVIFSLGRFTGVKGPGLFFIVPGIQQMVVTPLRTIVMDIPSQDIISQDNVSVRVNAVLYFKVVDPERAVIQIENYFDATSQLAQTTLRSVLGRHELDQMLSERNKLNADIQEILDEQTDGWGVKVTNVEIKYVELDDNMVRAIARQAEAERSRRAKVINAQGEFQASEKLFEAARVLSQQPEAIQLRYLQTLMDVANDKTSTIVFPFPMDMVKQLFNAPTNNNDQQNKDQLNIDPSQLANLFNNMRSDKTNETKADTEQNTDTSSLNHEDPITENDPTHSSTKE